MEQTETLYLKKDFDCDIRIIVETVRVEGHGVILLTGPSSCGKGEIAKALCKFLSIPKERHLSMGDILRNTIIKAKEDDSFKNKLSEQFGICHNKSILDMDKNKAEIIKKVESYTGELEEFFNKPMDEISQLDWLEFCVNKGLLIPDEWTEQIMDAAMENSEELHKGIFILDGYPRTITAAKKLLEAFNKAEIPIIKVLHLSITKHEMMNRALNRKREDDTTASLERRYNFYVDKVQPSIDYLKEKLGVSKVALIDAHQPVFNADRTLNVDSSIHNVVLSAIQSLGLPSYLLDLNIEKKQKKYAGGDKFMKTKKIVITALFIALSFIGANIKIMTTIAFDSMAGFLGALLLGPVYGALIGAMGNFLTSLTSGFPYSLPVHLIIMLGMAVTMLVFGYVYRYFSKKNYGVAVVLSLIVGVIINGPLLLIVLIPMLGKATCIELFPILSLAAGINIVIAQGIYKALPEKYRLWK